MITLTRVTRRRATKLIQLLGHPAYRRGLKYRVAAASEHGSMLQSIDVAAVIDVGANVGQFSLAVLAAHPNAEIHALEPLPEAAHRFESLFSTNRRVIMYPLAAGETSEVMTINISGRSDSSSILPISLRQEQIFPGTAKVADTRIPVVRLDELFATAEFPTPLLIKLDVQGYELAALRGMPELLQRASYVYVEVSFVQLYEGQPLAHEVVAWLAERSFRLSSIYNLTAMDSGQTVQADLLFSR